MNEKCVCFETDRRKENKLEHTTIHQAYVELAEEKLEAGMKKQLGSGFDFVAFLEQVVSATCASMFVSACARVYVIAYVCVSAERRCWLEQFIASHLH